MTILSSSSCSSLFLRSLNLKLEFKSLGENLSRNRGIECCISISFVIDVNVLAITAMISVKLMAADKFNVYHES